MSRLQKNVRNTGSYYCTSARLALKQSKPNKTILAQSIWRVGITMGIRINDCDRPWSVAIDL